MISTLEDEVKNELQVTTSLTMFTEEQRNCSAVTLSSLVKSKSDSTMNLLAAASETHKKSSLPAPPLTPKRSETPPPLCTPTNLFVPITPENIGNTQTNKNEPPISPGAKRKRATSLVGITSRRRSTSKEPGRWTRMEDATIKKFIEENPDDLEMNALFWEKVAKACHTGRSAKACEERWNQVLSRGLYKGRFSEEEDETIRKLAQDDGNKSDWRFIASQVSGRTAKQCRERWQNSLDPTLKQGEWSQDEDALLRAAHDRFGNAWGQVVRALPGRSQNMAKNRWNSNARRYAGENFGLSSPECVEKAKALVLTLPDDTLIKSTRTTKISARSSKKKKHYTTKKGMPLMLNESEEERILRESTESILTLSHSISGGSLDALVSAASQCFNELKESDDSSIEEDAPDNDQVVQIEKDLVLYDPICPQVRIGDLLRYKWGDNDLTDPQAPYELATVVQYTDDTSKHVAPAYLLRCLDLDKKLMRVTEPSSTFEPFVFTATLAPAQYGKEWLFHEEHSSLSSAEEKTQSSQSFTTHPLQEDILEQSKPDPKRPRRISTRGSVQSTIGLKTQQQNDPISTR